jgi:histidyl-tRNA synthetase
MRDFLPADVRRREYVIGVIKDVYERYGFEPLETPAVENIETLMGKYGEEGNQLIFKILKRGEHGKTGEADLALRYDLTVPLARVVAQYKNELPKFFKRYQIQPVWRADRPARGRFREFYQCDVDILGSRSMVVEAEICAAASEVLTKLGFNDFTIRINHRLLLDAMMSNAMIEKDERSSVLVAIDKLDKIGMEGVKQELARLEIPENKIDTILHLLTNKHSLVLEQSLQYEEISADNDEANRQWPSVLLKYFVGMEQEKIAAEAIGALQQVVDLCRGNSAARHIRIDPSLARGLSYYTGAIMEINVGGIGSLGGGGRYDNLVGMFSGDNVPACGFSLGLERIIVVMTERNMFPAHLVSSPADLMVTIWDDDSVDESIALAQELRGAGLRVDLYPEADKLGKQFKYASARDIRFVIVVGDEERSRGEVSIKDLRSGEQSSVKRATVAEEILVRMK